MRTIIVFSAIFFYISPLQAQSNKLPVYGSIAIGYGNTFFSGTLSEKETINDGRGFGRNQGYTLSSFFYVSPSRWKGFGLGTGVKGFFATPNNGGNNETYLFNYYHVGLGAKYYPFSKMFNNGFSIKTSFGIGQMTEKMKYNNTKTYEHQFAVGRTVLAGLGYGFLINKGKNALTIELEGETSNRRGDVTGLGEDQRFKNKHVSVNVGISF